MATFIERPLPGAIPYTDRTPWRGILHTTQGSSTTDYNNGADAPQLTVSVQRRQTWRHYDYMKHAGKALKHPQGTPATNTTRCVQIEVIGYCDDAHASDPLHIDKWTPADYDYLAGIMRRVEADTGMKRVSTVPWKGYGRGIPPNTSAGINNGVRLGNAAWARYEGWAGHMHVPNNDHGDPGDINIAELLRVTPPTPEKVLKMQWLAKTQGLTAVYFCDGTQIRWVQTQRQLDSIVGVMNRFGLGPEAGNPTPLEYGPGELDGGIAGVLVGPQAPDGTH